MYLVLEIQTGSGSGGVETVTTQINNFQDEADAQSNYHTVLASAATSSYPYHAALLLRNDGTLMEKRCYIHPIPEPEPTEGSEGSGNS